MGVDGERHVRRQIEPRNALLLQRLYLAAAQPRGGFACYGIYDGENLCGAGVHEHGALAREITQGTFIAHPSGRSPRRRSWAKYAASASSPPYFRPSYFFMAAGFARCTR